MSPSAVDLSSLTALVLHGATIVWICASGLSQCEPPCSCCSYWWLNIYASVFLNLHKDAAHKARLTGLPEFVYDYNMDQQKRGQLIDQEMIKQATIIEDLRYGVSVVRITIHCTFYNHIWQLTLCHWIASMQVSKCDFSQLMYSTVLRFVHSQLSVQPYPWVWNAIDNDLGLSPLHWWEVNLLFGFELSLSLSNLSSFVWFLWAGTLRYKAS